MRNNAELQKDVQNAISWEPTMHSAEIGVAAKDGVITLSGIVDSYSKKLNAEDAAKKVTGVKAVAANIAIRYAHSLRKNDAEIAKDILNTWKSDWEVPQDRVKVKVKNGWANLTGEVAWKFQEEASQDAIKKLAGVKGVNNFIKVKSMSKDIIEKKAVERALFRNWSIRSKDVLVEVDQNNVKLTGLVHSVYQKEEAGRLAWNSPGVWSVDNELAIIYS